MQTLRCRIHHSQDAFSKSSRRRCVNHGTRRPDASQRRREAKPLRRKAGASGPQFLGEATGLTSRKSWNMNEHERINSVIDMVYEWLFLMAWSINGCY